MRIIVFHGQKKMFAASFYPDEIKEYVYSSLDYEKAKFFSERECPFDVLYEVLAGWHDDRFDDWKNSSVP